MSKAATLQRELRTPALWLGTELAECPALPTGHAGLDGLLPGRGWPLGALIELLCSAEGCGELRLLMPALAKLCADGRQVVLVNPPYVPYAPALVQHGLRLSQLAWLRTDSAADAQWAAEQVLHSAATGALLMWATRIHETALRRLQLAAEASQATLFLYRPVTALNNASCAAVRLALRSGSNGLQIEVVKARGGRAGAALQWTAT
jgi:hypothetical protein